MTTQTLGGIVRGSALGLMNIVASGAGHFRGTLKTAASFKQIHLIAVDIETITGVRWLQPDIIRKRFARPERKRRRNRFPRSAMALCADVNLSVAAQPERRH